jgi:hypothetical protein
MTLSLRARARRDCVHLSWRANHGVGHVEYDDVATLSVAEARTLADELRGAADAAEASVGQARDAAIAEARKKMQALQLEIARLEAGGPT